MGKQPGVMFYFELRPCLERLTAVEKGVLFESILDYGQYGVVPDVEGVIGVAWDFIRPRLDRDRERYESICQKRTEAVNQRWERERQEKSDTNVYRSLPTATAIQNTTSLSKAVSAPTPESGLAAELDFNRQRAAAMARLDRAAADFT